jgi:hypothetical protein
MMTVHKGGGHETHKLHPPNFWARLPIKTQLTAADLVEFQKKADFLEQHVLQLEWVCSGRGEPIGEWPQKLLRPVIYRRRQSEGKPATDRRWPIC